MDVGVRELRNDLSQWLERVRDGEEVVVTDRGGPVARLVPAGWREEVAELAAKGMVTLPKSPKLPLGRRKGITARGSVSDLVAEQRQ